MNSSFQFEHGFSNTTIQRPRPQSLHAIFYYNWAHDSRLKKQNSLLKRIITQIKQNNGTRTDLIRAYKRTHNKHVYNMYDTCFGSNYAR